MTQISLVVLVFLVSTGRLRPVLGQVVDRVVAAMPRSEHTEFTETLRQARAAADEGDHAAAEALFIRAAAINPDDSQCLRGLIGARVVLGHYDQALRDADRLLQLFPGSADAYVLRAGVYEALGRVDRQRADLASADLLRGGATPEQLALAAEQNRQVLDEHRLRLRRWVGQTGDPIAGPYLVPAQ